MPEPPVIEIQDVSFAYEEALILENVNLRVEALDSVCIVGPNGGGKTTLLKLILGLLRPDQGKIRVFGKKPEQGRRLIGYVPQYAHYDPRFPVSVLDVVMMGRQGRRFGNFYTEADKKAASQAVAEMKLEDISGRLFADISGGQRQRVLIARALTCDARLLILDEPTANIDLQAESGFYSILRQLNERMTILVVTHDVGFVSTFFKRVACVNRQVIIHPTSEVTGQIIQDAYAGDICLIRHDHQCSVKGHFCG